MDSTTIRSQLSTAVADEVGEPVAAIALCRPDAPPRLLRRMFASSPQLGAVNVIVVTGTRVLVFAGRARAGAVRVDGLVGAWPLATTGVHVEDGMRVTLLPDGAWAPLTIDVVDDELGRAVLAALAG